MPEHPEVETVRAALGPRLEDRRIVYAEIWDQRLVAPLDPHDIAAELAGEHIRAVERRGKYLVIRFSSDRSLLIHLRMTGSLRHVRKGRHEADAYVRAALGLDDGSTLFYRDVRRFGTWTLVDRRREAEYLERRLGDEPLGTRFTAEGLGRRLQGRTIAVKGALLDQRTVAGLGNIYADEALWRARVHPLRPARGLSAEEVRRLHRAVRGALRLGILRQGATLRDYARPDGQSGGMQHEFRVYGREGESCDRCGTPIEKTRVSGRGTSFCPRCQV
jgi:formamidopyrimidine-DNA glycosylase